MPELLLVNPKRRKSRGKRRMSALQAQYFGPRAKRRRSKRRRVTRLARNPARRRSRRRSSVIAAAPVRHRRRRSHSRRRVTRLRRNPMRGFGGFSVKRFLNDTLIPAGVGAAGALAVDVALGYTAAYIPASFQTGIMHTGVKLAAAVGIGMVAGASMGKKFGEEAMAGAITVTLYDLLKSQVKTMMPTLPLSGYNMGWVSPGMQIGGLGAYVGSDRAYNGQMAGLGYYVGETDADYYKN